MNNKLEKKLDDKVREVVRKRDSQDGYFVCCTCGQRKDISQSQAGHFITRGNRCTRWDLRNVNLQCVGCNYGFNKAQYTTTQARYAAFIVRKYGKEVLDELVQKSHQVCKFYQKDGEDMLKKLSP